MIKAVIFDFDGTLTPLSLDFSRIKEEIKDIAREYATEEAIKETENDFLIEMIYRIEEKLNGTLAGSEFRKKAFDRLRFLELEASKGKDVFPYTREVLKCLKNNGVISAIITRTSIDVVRSVFTDMDNYISLAVTREDTRRVKPDPFHALEALRMVNVPPGKSMMVGDHPTDIMAGIGAGMTTAGVLSGRTKREEFEKAGAAFIMQDIRDILNLKVMKDS